MDKLNDLFTRIITKLNKKVDSVEGKQLSTNDFTTEEQIKLSGIEEGATNVQPSNTTPLAPAATGSVGSEMAFARGDHVHPLPEVGGRNLLTGTKDFSGNWTNHYGWVNTGETFNGLSIFRNTGDAWSSLYQEIPVEEFGEGLYTFSFYARVDNQLLVSIFTGNSGGRTFNMMPSEEMQRYSLTFRAEKQNKFKCRVEPNTTSNTYLYLCGYKLERGEIATDWTPAPEDLMPAQATIFDLYPDGISHNGIFRGNNLGTTPTEEQWKAITSGTFKNLFIGDYWENDNVKYRIAGFDIFLNTGDVRLTRHHAVIVPDTNLYTAQMNTTNTTDGAYYNSAMKKENLASALATVQTAFGDDHIVKRKTLLANATSGANASGWKWYETQIDLMTEAQVYGVRAWGAPAHNGYDIGEKYSRFPLFDLAPEYITNCAWYWLQDVYSAAFFCGCGADGVANCDYASIPGGVRPYFCIGSNDPDADMPVEGPEMMDEYMQSDEPLSPEFEKPIDRSPETEDEPLTE